jgi:hypothetical protein
MSRGVLLQVFAPYSMHFHTGGWISTYSWIIGETKKINPGVKYFKAKIMG